MNHNRRLPFRASPLEARPNSRKEDLTEDQRQEIKQAFTVFDSNSDGKLDYHELKVAMKALGFDAKKSEVLDLLRTYDPQNKRLITYDDFFQVMKTKILQRDPEEELRRAFDLFDVNHTGKITFADLKRVAHEIGENLRDDELQAMIDVFDLDEDGAISLEEFINLCSE